jgi:hypothetical protein
LKKCAREAKKDGKRVKELARAIGINRHFNARKSLDSRTVFRFHAKPQTKHFLYSP